MTITAKSVIQELNDRGVRRIKIGGVDVDGVVRGKLISKEKFASALEVGLGFCDVIFGWDCTDELYDNASITGWHTGYPDIHARVEIDSRRFVPWEDDTVFFLLDFFQKDGTPYAISPQQTLKRVVRRAHDMGFEPMMSTEYEFFVFEEDPHSVRKKGYRDMAPLSPGMFGYSVLRASMFSDLVGQIIEDMRSYRCPIEGFHTETGPGVYEVALHYDRALQSAQASTLLKTGIKEIVARHGLIATFMAKWNADLPGCSGHIHQSLWNPECTANLFAVTTPGKTSELLEHYTAGILHTLPEFTAFYAPTINSYKRLVEGTWAPTNATWGHENRTTAARVITSSEKASRVELRTSGADINPFLAYAATLAAGLYGIENKLRLPAPCEGNAYDPARNYPPLPSSLAEATELLAKSEIARTLLGSEFVDHYVATRRWEVRQAAKVVTQWELERYFEVI